MENWGEYWEIATILLGCTGIWKIVELLIKSKFDKRLRDAETKNHVAQAEGQIVSNWIDWSRHLEQLVKELERKVEDLKKVLEENKELKRIDKLQKKVIDSLEATVKELEKEIKILKSIIHKLEKQLEK